MSPITDIRQLDINGYYTITDYMTWRFPERVELLLGKIFKMSPAPSTRHQEISSQLHIMIGMFLLEKSCKVFSAPFDVKLPVSLTKDKVDTVVQPDISVVCDLSKLDEQGCNGAPDIVIEILSPGNAKKEMKDKYDLYEQSGVAEYWIVDPVYKTIRKYLLNDMGAYTPVSALTTDDILESSVLKGFQLSLAKLFEEA